jgi:hypothetical protein
MLDTYRLVGGKWGILIEGGYLLPWILVQAAVAAIILIIAPLVLIRSGRGSGRAPPRVLAWVCAYFASIGAGFIFVEISLIQRLTPALGEPVYAVSVVLFSVLLSTGAGSYMAARAPAVGRNPERAILTAAALVLIYLFILTPLGGLLTSLPAAARYVAAFFAIFPLGLSLGVAFPAGMKLVGETWPELIAWAWCVNGSVSVVGSVLVIMAAVAWGFSTALAAAVLFYLFAAFSFVALKALASKS